MRRPQINAEELVPWCERRGLDASLLVAEQPEHWQTSRGLHYRLRLPGEGPHFVDVVAPLDDPMPPLYRHDEPERPMIDTMTQEALLDLIEAHTEAVVRATVAALHANPSSLSRQREASEAHRAVLDAVRSLPIEAGR